MSISAPSISSIGQLCQTVQSSYTAVRRAIESLGIEPALTIDNVPHYPDSDMERIAEHLKGQK